jgi:hypothetical protein
VCYSSVAMASYSRRQVHFRSRNNKRIPYDDEFSVMRSFSRHIQSCRTCVTPAGPETRLLLCQRGYSYAKDVFRYMRLQNGRVVSNLEPELSGTQTEIEVPASFAIVSRLLSEVRGTPMAQPKSTSTSEHRPAKDCTSRRLEISSSRHQKLKLDSQTYKDGGDFVTISAIIPAIRIPLQIKRSDLEWLYDSKRI